MPSLGYADRLSVEAGERIRFMVSMDVPTYQADFVRLLRATLPAADAPMGALRPSFRRHSAASAPVSGSPSTLGPTRSSPTCRSCASTSALGVIEAVVARAAARRITTQVLGQLELILTEAERRIPDDVPGHLAPCREFRRRLGQAAQTPFLARQLVAIEERSDMYLIHSRQRLPPENMAEAVRDRRRILDAVRGGDPDAAARAAVAHADSIRVRWKSFYPGQPAEAR